LISQLLHKYEQLKDTRSASLVAPGILYIFNSHLSNQTASETYREQLLSVASAIAKGNAVTDTAVLILLDVLEGITEPDDLVHLTDDTRRTVFELMKQALNQSISSISATNTQGITIAKVCFPSIFTYFRNSPIVLTYFLIANIGCHCELACFFSKLGVQ